MWPSTWDGGEYRAISEERWKECSAEMWPSTRDGGEYRGQFQRKGGKSGVQRRSSRRGWLAAAPTTGPRKKTKKRWKGILKEEVAKLDDDLSS
jgi:hypothetical protein